MITAAIDDARRGQLSGHIHPLAKAADDLGPVDPSTVLTAVTLELRQAPEKQAELDALLTALQDPSSPDYHRWLAPSDFAARFGAAPDDIDQIAAWLEGQNLHVTGISPARNAITFTASAGDIDHALRTALHSYSVNGRTHYANSEEPSLPVALEPAIRAIHGLHNFRMHPQLIERQTLDPNYTSTSGNHYLSPDDIATIYNVKPLWSSGYDGSGQNVVIAGQTQVDVTDIQKFRARFQLPASDPTMTLVPHTTDPGVSKSDVPEADLDLEWAGAAAPNAKLIYVYSYDVMDAVKYAIDQNLAPVISVSYGLCEAQTPSSDVLTMQSWARQGNAQGITWIDAAGDSGGADCISGNSTQGAGLSVDTPASIPEVTGVGGTAFGEGSGSYWNSTSSADGGSALSYIPESVWNDSTPGNPSAGGGGASVYFAQPSWQTGPGVPANNARNVPDLALSASADHDGYLVYTGGQLEVYGGTSAATPTFAGMTVLLNQYLVSAGGQAAPGAGNLNPRLYALAQSSVGAFHDITTGNNVITVTCGIRSRNCVAGSYGYPAGPGYDQASGLGSVDAFKLITAWPAAASTRLTPALSVNLSATTVASNGSVIATATVTGSGGVTPAGNVTFFTGTSTLGVASLTGTGGTATSTLTISAAQLQPGVNTLTAVYSGDSTFNRVSNSVTISVTGATSSGVPSIAGSSNAASYRQTYAPGMVLAIFGANLADTTAVASTVPLPTQMSNVTVTIGGVAAPLYYVSPAQLNVQIPYEVPANQLATVMISNGGRTASASLMVNSAAPGLFTDTTGFVVPVNTAARNQAIALYFTGAGAVSPAVATGAAPAGGTPLAQLPAPVQGVSVSIGGVDAPVQFVGIPEGLVGVVQVNVQVSANTPLGLQPVVVTVGGVASAAAQMTVTAQ